MKAKLKFSGDDGSFCCKRNIQISFQLFNFNCTVFRMNYFVCDCVFRVVVGFDVVCGLLPLSAKAAASHLDSW